MEGKKRKIGRKVLMWICVFTVFFLQFLYISQRFWGHREEYFYPDYERVHLTEESDYETIFMQTGLGRQAVEKVLKNDNFTEILKAQENFWIQKEVICTPLLGWFTREDKVVADESAGVCFLDLQPGDILVTLATHSFGWHHGHAALVLDEEHTLESAVWGTDSTYGKVENWKKYSNVAVLRVKDVSAGLQGRVVQYAEEKLYGVPYHLSAGFIGEKAPDVNEPHFGVQCAYLVWYAWERFGFDLDADGGRMVTANDLLGSDKAEVVQLYGMDPRKFTEKQNKCLPNT